MVVAEQKAATRSRRFYRKLRMPKPEGYRKALRAMQMAAKFGRPIITLRRYSRRLPGIDAEERGQAEAIAATLREMARLPVPVWWSASARAAAAGRSRWASATRSDAGECGLQRDLAGELRGHHLPRFG